MLAPVLPLLLALVADTPSAPPAPTRVVVLATGKTPALDAVAAEAELLGRQRVGATQGLVPVDATAPSRTAAEALVEARQLVEEGEGAYAELETKKAIAALRRATALLEAELDALQSQEERDVLLRALALLGSVHNQSGDRAAAERTFLKLLALAPTYTLDEATFPPGDVSLLERLQEKLAFTEPGTLEITSGGVPAGVWLDGRFRGFTPLTLEDVEPGAHLWLVRRQGALPAHGSVVLEGKPAQVKARLEGPPSDRELPARVRRLVVERMNLHPTYFALVDAMGKPDELVAVVADEDAKSGPVLRLVRTLPEDGVLVGYREVALGDGWQERYLTALDELLAAPTTPDIPTGAVASAPDVKQPEGESDSALLWVAGAAGGVVLTAAAVSAVVAVVALSSASGGAGDPARDPHALARRRVVLGF